MAYSSLSALQKSLKDLQVRDLARGIEHFLFLVSENSAFYNKLAALSARYRFLLSEKHSGLILGEAFDKTRGEVVDALLSYISDLEAGDLKPGTIDPSLEMDWEALEREGMASLAKLLVDKINRLREALIFEDHPTRQMKYEREIAESEAQLRAIREQL